MNLDTSWPWWPASLRGFPACTHLCSGLFPSTSEVPLSLPPAPVWGAALLLSRCCLTLLIQGCAGILAKVIMLQQPTGSGQARDKRKKIGSVLTGNKNTFLPKDISWKPRGNVKSKPALEKAHRLNSGLFSFFSTNFLHLPQLKMLLSCRRHFW